MLTIDFLKKCPLFSELFHRKEFSNLDFFIKLLSIILLDDAVIN